MNSASYNNMNAPIQSEQNTDYRSDIQAYRAIAVIAVVLYHTGGLLPGGFFGVDVFFVISGYVICQLVLREIRLSKNYKFKIGQFFFRRFKRLAPPLSVTIIASLVLSIFLISPIGPLLVSAKTGLAAQAFTSNIFIGVESGNYFTAGASQNIFLHTWSLAVEEQFYIIFAVFIFLFSFSFRWIPLNIKTYKILLLILTIFAIAVSILYGLIVANSIRIQFLPSILFGWYLPEFSFYNPVSRVWEILTGCLLGYFTARFGFLPERITKRFGIVGIVFVSTAFLGILPSSNMPNQYTLVPIIGTLFILMNRIENFHNQKLSLIYSSLIFIGDRSYGLYLIHWPIFVFGGHMGSGIFFNLVLALVSLFLADILYKRIEIPLKHKNFNPGFDQSRFIAKTLAPVLMIIGIVVFLDDRNLFSESVKELKRAVQQDHITQRNNCLNTNPIYFNSSKRCDFNDFNDEREVVYLVGDSNADHLSEAIVGASKNLSMSVNTSIKAGCSFVYPGESNCEDFVHETFRYLADAKVGTLVVSMSESAWDKKLPEQQGNNLSGIANELTRLSARGFRIFLVKPVPKFYQGHENSNAQNCSTLQIMLENCPRVLHIKLTEIDRHRQLALMGISSLSLLAQMKTIDLDNFFCAQIECTNSIDGVPLYRDNAHITVDVSESMIGEFTKVLNDGR